MNDLLIHPKTKKQTDSFLKKPVSPLLILGPAGSGKLSLARVVAYKSLELDSESALSRYTYFHHLKRPDAKQDISIDAVRETNHFLRLKTPGSAKIRRVVLIEDAHYLSLEAQTALLKILEEPNGDALFVLTAPSELSLLPTIVSRAQHVRSHPVSLQQVSNYYGSRFGARKIKTAWLLSQGNVSLLEALLADKESHPLKQAIESAKSFLRQTPYERLLFLDKTSKNKEDLRLFLEALSKILSALHRSAVAKGRQKQASRLLDDRKLVMASVDALDKNVNPRLLCLDLALSLNS